MASLELDLTTAVHRGDPGWDAARSAYNLAVDQLPAAVVRPSSPAQLAAAVRAAGAAGLQVAPQSTGHNARPLGSLAGSVLVRTDGMRGVAIDAEARRATVAAGARWADVVPAAAEHGLIALHGTAPDVGIVGYTLGGGLSWYGRRHGLAANRVTAARIVTADGVIRHVDANSESDLFWAVRGGGGSFGVVAELEFELLPFDELAAGALVFPPERASEVLKAWRRWTEDLPDEMTSIARVIGLGDTVVRIEAVWLGAAEAGEGVLAPLRELGPIEDTFARSTPELVSELHMDPPEPFPYAGEGQLVSELDDAAIDGIVGVLGREPGSAGYIHEIRTLGGAVGRPDPRGGALPSLPAAYMSFGAAVTGDDAIERAVRARLRRLRAVLEPFDAGSLTTFAEAFTDPARLFPPATLARLRQIRGSVDPAGLIHPNHRIA